MKWIFYFEQINADVVHVESEGFEDAVKKAREEWRMANLPAEIRSYEKLGETK